MTAQQGSGAEGAVGCGAEGAAGSGGAEGIVVAARKAPLGEWGSAEGAAYGNGAEDAVGGAVQLTSHVEAAQMVRLNVVAVQMAPRAVTAQKALMARGTARPWG